MAVIRDVMPAFELFQPASIADALSLLDRYGSDAWVFAGGLDSFDWLKDRIKRPRYVVDLGAVGELKGIRERDGGLEIGAMTTLTDVVRHMVVRERYAIARIERVNPRLNAIITTRFEKARATLQARKFGARITVPAAATTQ